MTHSAQDKLLEKFGFALIVVLLRSLSVLPFKFVARLGSALGGALYALPSRRKHVVLVNLRLCFPEKTMRERDELAREHFRHVVRSYLERGIQWFGSAQAIRDRGQLESDIDLDDKNAPPAIFMGFHFVGIEVGCMLYSTRFPVASLYTRMSIARLCDMARRQRGRFGAEMLERATSARRIVALLRSGKPVMLAADMDQGVDNSVFVSSSAFPPVR
jgi:KDO2-lipid IV(A) lauroyltransferase